MTGQGHCSDFLVLPVLQAVRQQQRAVMACIRARLAGGSQLGVRVGVMWVPRGAGHYERSIMTCMVKSEWVVVVWVVTCEWCDVPAGGE